MIYYDACYIAKFYLAEPDSADVIAFANANPHLGCLLTGKAEVIAVFHRKFREGIVDEPGFHLLCDQFASDCSAGLWQWCPLDDTSEQDALGGCREVIDECRPRFMGIFGGRNCWTHSGLPARH